MTGRALAGPQALLQQAEASARAALGEDAFRAAPAEGRSIPVAELLVEAVLLERP